uniref:Uncharacterized protein n=1 Tax=Rhizophagus irregularis (strain DAOM 181602 / DAOM 197198 / MUCL 43194) TaxID=747089 RepID=U9TXA7_RHIID
MDRPCLIEEIFHLCDEKIQKVVNSAAKSIENAEAEYNERINQITRYRSELIKRISETNKIKRGEKKYFIFRGAKIQPNFAHTISSNDLRNSITNITDLMHTKMRRPAQ